MYVLLRPHQNGSVLKVPTSAGVSKLLAIRKAQGFQLSFLRHQAISGA